MDLYAIPSGERGDFDVNKVNDQSHRQHTIGTIRRRTALDHVVDRIIKERSRQRSPGLDAVHLLDGMLIHPFKYVMFSLGLFPSTVRTLSQFGEARQQQEKNYAFVFRKGMLSKVDGYSLSIFYLPKDARDIRPLTGEINGCHCRNESQTSTHHNNYKSMYASRIQK